MFLFKIFLLWRYFVVILRPFYILWYNPITIINPSILSLGTSLNRLNKSLLSLKNLHVSVKSMQSRRICLVVKGVSQPMHTRAGFSFKRWEWVSLLWPILSLVKTTSSRWFIHWQWSVKSGTISFRLLVILSHCSFQISLTYCADFSSQSKAATMEFKTGDSRALPREMRLLTSEFQYLVVIDAKYDKPSGILSYK